VLNKVPYVSTMGRLMYAMVCTRPNIALVVGTVSQFLSNPHKEHWNDVKWILRYPCGTGDLRLCFGGDKPTLMGYSYLNMVGDIYSKKSTSGYLIKFARGVVVCSIVYYKGRVHCHYKSMQGVIIVTSLLVVNCIIYFIFTLKLLFINSCILLMSRILSIYNLNIDRIINRINSIYIYIYIYIYILIIRRILFTLFTYKHVYMLIIEKIIIK